MSRLRDLQVLDGLPEEEFGQLASLAAQVCGAPISLISVVDQDQQWFLGAVGLDVAEASRDHSFYWYAMQSSDLLEVEDATADIRFKFSDLVTGKSHIRFYAGVPVRGGSEAVLGTLCVMDTVPRQLTTGQRSALKSLGWQVEQRVRQHEGAVGETASESAATSNAQPQPAQRPLRNERKNVAWRSGAGSFQVLLGTFLATIYAFKFGGRIDHALYLWPVSAVSLAIAVSQSEAKWQRHLSLQIFAAIGFLAGARFVGLPLWLASTLLVMNCLDLLLGRLLLVPAVRTFDDLRRTSSLRRFLIAVVTIPLASACVGVFPFSYHLGLPLAEALVLLGLSRSLGMVVIFPPLLFLRPKRIPDLRMLFRTARLQGLPAIAIFLAVTWFVFWRSNVPILFVIFAPMIAVVLLWGVEGAVFNSVALTIMGWVATSHGHGPIFLMKAPPLGHLIALQLFVWVCFMTTLPIGAILDERKSTAATNSRLSERLQESNHVFQSFMDHGPFISYIKMRRDSSFFTTTS